MAYCEKHRSYRNIWKWEFHATTQWPCNKVMPINDIGMWAIQMAFALGSWEQTETTTSATWLIGWLSTQREWNRGESWGFACISEQLAVSHCFQSQQGSIFHYCFLDLFSAKPSMLLNLFLDFTQHRHPGFASISFHWAKTWQAMPLTWLIGTDFSPLLRSSQPNCHMVVSTLFQQRIFTLLASRDGAAEAPSGRYGGQD